MNRNRSLSAGAVALAALGLLIGATAWARQDATAELKQVGETSIVYRGPELEMAMSYRFAKAYPGEPWLLLDVLMKAAGEPVEVKRGEVSVRIPDGRVIPLATQEEFATAYGALRPAIMRANVAAQPLDYLTPHRARRLEFFANPGQGLAFSTAWLNDQWEDVGRLYFDVPGGVQKGQYELRIQLLESLVTIPFTV